MTLRKGRKRLEVKVEVQNTRRRTDAVFFRKSKLFSDKN
jgi:hypothetical protein